jgi:hypothetical protein
MLTFLTMNTNFHPLMRIKKIVAMFFMVAVLQSCYTMLYPPQTLPQTVTTVVSQPAMVSSIGGSGVYGWDPYWEPALPFTSYYAGYGASYYSPYNYYDYHHPHYAPVYVVSESREPVPARNFDRDDLQGGSRVRERNDSALNSSSGNPGNATGIGSGLSSAASPIINPIVTDPVVSKTPIILKPANNEARPVIKDVNPVKVRQPRPAKAQKAKAVKQPEASEKSDSPAPQKRNRIRK